MSSPSVKKNFLMSTAYQVLIIILPFITTPYFSRVLGAGPIGIYSYTQSYQTYFSMFAALGTMSYGTREIARFRDDVTKRSVLFWEIELMYGCMDRLDPVQYQIPDLLYCPEHGHPGDHV